MKALPEYLSSLLDRYISLIQDYQDLTQSQLNEFHDIKSILCKRGVFTEQRCNG